MQSLVCFFLLLVSYTFAQVQPAAKVPPTITPIVPQYKLPIGKLVAIRWTCQGITKRDVKMTANLCAKDLSGCVPLPMPLRFRERIIEGRSMILIPPTTKPGSYAIKLFEGRFSPVNFNVEVEVPSTTDKFQFIFPPGPWAINKNITIAWAYYPMPGYGNLKAQELCLVRGARNDMSSCLWKKSVYFQDGFVELPMNIKWPPSNDYYLVTRRHANHIPGQFITRGPFTIAPPRTRIDDSNDNPQS